MPKRILIVSFSNIKSDPRVQRQINTLKNDYSLTVLGFGNSSGHSEVPILSINPPSKRANKYKDAISLFLHRFKKYYYSLPLVQETEAILIGKKFDVIVANDIEALPVVLKTFQTSKVWFDAHEYSPREFEHSLKWRLFFKSYKNFLCKSYIPLAHKTSTVCDGLAREYQKEFNVQMEVIKNATEFKDLIPSNTGNNKIRIVHHGAAIRARHLEKMIQLMGKLEEKFELNLILVPTDEVYLSELKTLAKERFADRVSFLDPVPLNQISEFINQFDLGLYILEPIGFNHEFALPNKLFEFIQARLGIVIGPSPEMAKIVIEHELGLVCKSFDLEDFANMINLLKTEDIDKFKCSSHKNAKVLSFDEDAAKIKKLVSELA